MRTFALACLCLSYSFLQAQNQFYTSTGLNLSSIHLNGLDYGSAHSETGIYIGQGYQFGGQKLFGFQEFQFALDRYRIQILENKTSFRKINLKAIIGLQLKFLSNFKVSAGQSIHLNVLNYEKLNRGDWLKSHDKGLRLGNIIGFSYTNRNVSFSIRYLRNLKKSVIAINDPSGDSFDTKGRDYSIQVGLKFAICERT